MNVYIDIETTGASSEDILNHYCSHIKVPGSYTKEESIQKYIKEKSEDAYAATALLGHFGEISAIGFAIEDGVPGVLLNEGNDERDLIRSFFDSLRAVSDSVNKRLPHFVGFNISEFDLPFIWQRAVIRGLKPPVPLHQLEKPWSSRITDLRYILGCGERKGTLLDWCVATGCPVPSDDPPGDMMPHLWQEGRRDEVREHCRRDVERIQWLHRMVQFQ